MCARLCVCVCGWKAKTHINVNKMAKAYEGNKQQQKLRLFSLSHSLDDIFSTSLLCATILFLLLWSGILPKRLLFFLWLFLAIVNTFSSTYFSPKPSNPIFASTQTKLKRKLPMSVLSWDIKEKKTQIFDFEVACGFNKKKEKNYDSNCVILHQKVLSN